MLFSDVVGQSHITRTLENAIKTNRVAHAFIFSGVRGVGKTSMARILAKSLNCSDGPTFNPCGNCESCRTITSGKAVDVIEIDGASNNSVNDVRELRDTVPYRPSIGQYKIYVIDEAHMLTTSAFNALLKTLEEPPDHVKFILATTEPQKIPITILSRCQRYDFRRIPTNAITDRIKMILKGEDVEYEESALSIISHQAQGSMRDALSILDQVLAAGEEKISQKKITDLLGIVNRQILADLCSSIINRSPARCLKIISDVNSGGYDIITFCGNLLEYFRNLTVVKVLQSQPDFIELTKSEFLTIQEMVKDVPIPNLHRIFKQLSEAYEIITKSPYPLIMLESTIARIADLEDLSTIDELIKRLENLAGENPPPAATNSGDIAEGRSRPAPTTNSENIVTAVSPTQEWDDFFTFALKTSPSVAPVLEHCEHKFEENGTKLNLSFANNKKTLMDIASNQTDKISTLLNSYFNKTIQVKIEASTSKKPDEITETQKRISKENHIMNIKDSARQHSFVRKAITELNGHIANIEVFESDNE